jgi:hypothetical protein
VQGFGQSAEALGEAVEPVGKGRVSPPFASQAELPGKIPQKLVVHRRRRLQQLFGQAGQRLPGLGRGRSIRRRGRQPVPELLGGFPQHRGLGGWRRQRAGGFFQALQGRGGLPGEGTQIIPQRLGEFPGQGRGPGGVEEGRRRRGGCLGTGRRFRQGLGQAQKGLQHGGQGGSLRSRAAGGGWGCGQLFRQSAQGSEERFQVLAQGLTQLGASLLQLAEGVFQRFAGGLSLSGAELRFVQQPQPSGDLPQGLAVEFARRPAEQAEEAVEAVAGLLVEVLAPRLPSLDQGG